MDPCKYDIDDFINTTKTFAGERDGDGHLIVLVIDAGFISFDAVGENFAAKNINDGSAAFVADQPVGEVPRFVVVGVVLRRAVGEDDVELLAVAESFHVGPSSQFVLGD